MGDNNKCGKCRSNKNEGLVGCEGSCSKWFHFSCCNLNATEFSMLSKSKNLYYLCDICRKKCEIVEVDSIKVQNDRLSSINDKLSNIADLIQENVQSALLKFKEEIVQLIHTDINESILSKFEPSSSKQEPASNPSVSYANVAQKQPSFVVKPKVKQNTSVTKTDMIKNINPVCSDISLANVVNVSDGGIMISCLDKDDCNKFKQLADERLTEKYTIKEIPVLYPRVKVVGMSEKLSDDELLNRLTVQNKNEIYSNSDLKLISSAPLRNNKNLFQAVIQCDIATYQRIMLLGKLFVGYDYCRVFDAINLIRCYKCCGYHHTARNCRSNITICPLCAQNHQMNECPNSEINYCINCHNFNKITDKPVPANHTAMSNNCYVRLQNLEKLRSNILSPK